jgi:hypothetical protein
MSAADPADEGARPEVVLAEAVLAEADELMRLTAARSLTVRLTGSLAIRVLCPVHAPLLVALGRRPYRDIDLMAYSKQKREIAALFEGRGYILDPSIRLAQEFGIKRFVYSQPGTGLKADVFFDELVMAHTVDFHRRLELDKPTITATDLLLSKLQIHEFTVNDLIDCIVLLAEYDLGTTAPRMINDSYIANIMRKDWGFYYTTRENLKKVVDSLTDYPALPADVASSVRARLGKLDDAIEQAPKTQRWKLRARVGSRVKWYEDVEEVSR